MHTYIYLVCYVYIPVSANTANATKIEMDEKACACLQTSKKSSSSRGRAGACTCLQTGVCPEIIYTELNLTGQGIGQSVLELVGIVIGIGELTYVDTELTQFLLGVRSVCTMQIM